MTVIPINFLFNYRKSWGIKKNKSIIPEDTEDEVTEDTDHDDFDVAGYLDRNPAFLDLYMLNNVSDVHWMHIKKIMNGMCILTFATFYKTKDKFSPVHNFLKK